MRRGSGVLSGCVFGMVKEVKVLVERGEGGVDWYVVFWVSDGKFEVSAVGLVAGKGNGWKLGVRRGQEQG